MNNEQFSTGSGLNYSFDAKAPTKLISKDSLETYFGDLQDINTNELLVAYATKLLENLDQRLLKLGLAIDGQQNKDIIYFAHQLRGSFNTVGCAYLAGLCEHIERTANQSDYESLKQSHNNIQRLIGSFKKELTQFLGQPN